MHGGLILIHDYVAIRDGSAGWHDEHNDTRMENGSMLHKSAGQLVVLAKGRVETNDKAVSIR